MADARDNPVYNRYVHDNYYNQTGRFIDKITDPDWEDLEHADPADRVYIDRHRKALQKNPRMNGDGSISTVYINGVTGPDGRIYNLPGYDYQTGAWLGEEELYDYWNSKGKIKDFSSFGPDEGHLANEQAQRIHSKWIDPDMEAYDMGEREKHRLAYRAMQRGLADRQGGPIQNLSNADAAKNYAGGADWALRMRDSMPDWLPSGVSNGLASGISKAMAHGYQAKDLAEDVFSMGLGAAVDDYNFDIRGNIDGIEGALRDKNTHLRTPDELISEGLAYGYKQR